MGTNLIGSKEIDFKLVQSNLLSLAYGNKSLGDLIGACLKCLNSLFLLSDKEFSF